MSYNLHTLLKTITLTARFNFCYLLEIKNDNHSIIIEKETKITKTEVFATFNKAFYTILNFDTVLVENDESFNNFLIVNDFKQYYIKKIYHTDDLVYCFFAFSKKKYKNNKILTEIRNNFISILTNEIEAIVNTKRVEAELNEINDLKLIKETLHNIDYVFYRTEKNLTYFEYSKNALANLLDTINLEPKIETKELTAKIIPQYLQKFESFRNDIKSNKISSVEYQIRSNLGIEKYIRQLGIPIFEGEKLKQIVGVIQNISKEKIVLQKLEKAEETLKAFSDTYNSLLFILDTNGYFNFINEIGSIILGFSKDELVGRHFLEFIDDDSKADVAIAFQKIFESGNKVSFKVKIVDRFKSKIEFEINAKSIKYDNKVSGMIGVGEDVSDKLRNDIKVKELSSKLLEVNRLISIEKDRAKHQISVLEELNRLKNDFISNVSHELRTPLASIVGFAETIVSDKDLPTEMIHEFNTIILEEGKRLAKLINDILDFSKLEGGIQNLVKQKFDLILVLREMVETYTKIAEAKGLKLNVQIPDAEMIVNADKERITKVFANLLSNAVKFTKFGGLITIITQDFLKEVEIVINDTGIGIPKEDLGKIFQKFSKINRPGTQEPGAGFGLSIAKQIIDSHRGLIRVESEVNKGTSFIVRLPKE
ncbi:MAG: PAS domain-containing sensor histidine kinase [bacterium]